MQCTRDGVFSEVNASLDFQLGSNNVANGLNTALERENCHRLWESIMFWWIQK